MPDINEQYEQEHLRNISGIGKRILKIYQDAIEQLKVTINTVNYKGTLFNVNDYPALRKKIDSVVSKMQTDIYAASVNGIKDSWDLSNKKNKVLIDQRLAGKQIKTGIKQALYDPNNKALQAFITRVNNGLNLSDRIWNLLDPFKKELEQTIGIGLGAGQSAAEMATDAKKYLTNPDKLFRRVRGEDGKLYLSAAARNYHPGQGIYRSSYKNALRLTRTENNIAYRTSDYLRWQTMPFVIGIEVKTSGNHPKYDICDQLAGIYPKDFLFTGWHPQCICFQVAKQMTDKEFETIEDQILAGEPVTANSKATVTTTPRGFKDFLKTNKDRINGWSSTPYWINDNPQYVNGLLSIKTGDKLTTGFKPAATVISNQFTNISSSVSKKVNIALSAIDAVHGDGTLDDIPFEKVTKVDFNAALVLNADRSPQKILISSKKANPELSAIHEMGHLLDLQGMGTKNTWTSPLKTGPLKDVIDAALATSTLKNMQQILDNGFFEKDGRSIPVSFVLSRHIQYLLDPREIWARSYAQFIAARSGSSLLQDGINSLLELQKTIPHKYQWEADDFKSIELAIEKTMEQLGWISQ